jgi:DoxX-like protein
MEDNMKTGHENSLVRHSPTAARVLLGLLFFGSGLANLLNLAPQPSLPDGAAAFTGAMMKTGYMMPLVFTTQFIVGTLLLANRFVPLALALLAPFVVHSLAFHAVLERSGLPVACAVLALLLYLAWVYRQAYRAMLVPKITPGRTERSILAGSPLD